MNVDTNIGSDSTMPDLDIGLLLALNHITARLWQIADQSSRIQLTDEEVVSYVRVILRQQYPRWHYARRDIPDYFILGSYDAAPVRLEVYSELDRLIKKLPL
jgi:hypothetical protein